eukprot:GHVS01063087.1.p1 GENE.GHVS01063087.1~~GHVS01063087.1.p1  ORF type:complete len:255 (+),score=36.23 GHVS01063087.1:13-777(+)
MKTVVACLILALSGGALEGLSSEIRDSLGFVYRTSSLGVSRNKLRTSSFSSSRVEGAAQQVISPTAQHGLSPSETTVPLYMTIGGSDGAAANWRGAESISKLTESTAHAVFDIEQIKTILPHRFPFLLVDKVLEFEPGKRAVGIKQISMNEDQFNGHFPQRAILPGVMQVEALAQLGGIVCLQQPVSDGTGNFFFAGVDGVKWKKPVVPGDTLVLEVALDSWKSKFGIAKLHGKGYVDGKLAVEVKEMTFALVK